MEYFIVFDAGAVGIFLLILLLGGTAAVGAAGVWLYEHFWVLALAVFILSLIKSLICCIGNKCAPVKGFICAVCDCVKLIPLLYFLWIFFKGFTGLSDKGFFGLVGSIILNVLGFMLFMLPELLIVGGMECICAGLLEELDDTGAVWLYIIVSAIGSGLQCLAFWIFSKL